MDSPLHQINKFVMHIKENIKQKQVLIQCAQHKGKQQAGPQYKQGCMPQCFITAVSTFLKCCSISTNRGSEAEIL